MPAAGEFPHLFAAALVVFRDAVLAGDPAAQTNAVLTLADLVAAGAKPSTGALCPGCVRNQALVLN